MSSYPFVSTLMSIGFILKHVVISTVSNEVASKQKHHVWPADDESLQCLGHMQGKSQSYLNNITTKQAHSVKTKLELLQITLIIVIVSSEEQQGLAGSWFSSRCWSSTVKDTQIKMWLTWIQTKEKRQTPGGEMAPNQRQALLSLALVFPAGQHHVYPCRWIHDDHCCTKRAMLASSGYLDVSWRWGGEK